MDRSSALGPPTWMGNHRLLAQLARGGMAEVYLARSQGVHGFGKTVAIKKILPHFAADPAFLRMLVDEARITVLLSHPNIAQVFEFGQQRGDYFLVMEFVPGHSLSKLTKRMQGAGESLDLLDACFIVVEVLQGLHAAHEQRDERGRPARIVHRDVSPQNVLVTYDGQVKLIDFGIARARDRLERTEAGVIKGKLRYLAPEMLAPERFGLEDDFDHRVDIFAAAIVLFELIAERRLFAGDREMDVYDAILDQPIPDLAQEGRCDEVLMAIMMRGLARSPHDRYASAGAFADDLRAYLHGQAPGYAPRQLAARVQAYFAEERESIEQLLQADHIAPPNASASRSRRQSDPPRVPIGVPVATEDLRSETKAARVSHGAWADPPRTGAGPGRIVSPRDVTQLEAEGWELDALADDAAATLPGPTPDAGTLVDRTAEMTMPTVRGTESERVSGNEHGVGAAPAAARSPPTSPRNRFGQGGRRWRFWGVSMLTAALIGIAAASWFSRGDSRGVIEAGEETPSARPQSIPLLLDAKPDGATVRRFDRDHPPSPVPVVWMVEEGTALDVLFEAPGFSSHRQSIEIPRGHTNTRLDITLQALRVALELQVFPSDAHVTLDGEPWHPSMTLAPGRPVTVEASHPDFQTFRGEWVAEPGKPFVVDVRLTRKPQVGPGRTVGRGTLTLVTTPYWGRVIIDGKTLEETTPVTVTLRAGTHQVEVSHPPRGIVKRFRVRIEPNRDVRRTISFE